MIAVVGIVMAVILVAAAVWIFYTAGQRGGRQERKNRETAAKGTRDTVPHQAGRAQGRGDL